MIVPREGAPSGMKPRDVRGIGLRGNGCQEGRPATRRRRRRRVVRPVSRSFVTVFTSTSSSSSSSLVLVLDAGIESAVQELLECSKGTSVDGR